MVGLRFQRVSSFLKASLVQGSTIIVAAFRQLFIYAGSQDHSLLCSRRITRFFDRSCSGYHRSSDRARTVQSQCISDTKSTILDLIYYMADGSVL
jgi:hypothetical protein